MLGAILLQYRHPVLSRIAVHLPGMGDANHARQVAGGVHRVDFTELIEFQLHVLGQQFANEEPVIQKARCNHSLTQPR